MCGVSAAGGEHVNDLAVLDAPALVRVDAGLVGPGSAVDARRRAGGRDVDEVAAGAAECAVPTEGRVDRVVAGTGGLEVRTRSTVEVVGAGCAVQLVVAQGTG